MDTLAHILDIPRTLLSINTIALAHLPITEGGLGLIVPGEVADAAYVAAFAASLESLTTDFPEIGEMLNPIGFITPIINQFYFALNL